MIYIKRILFILLFPVLSILSGLAIVVIIAVVMPLTDAVYYIRTGNIEDTPNYMSVTYETIEAVFSYLKRKTQSTN